GPMAHRWIDVLARTGQTWWQVLPLGPTGYGDSPYQCFSAFAGNPYLVSPELLVRDGLVTADAVAGVRFSAGHVEYGPVIQFKQRLLRQAWDNFRGGRGGHLRGPFDEFCARQASWLTDFALFMALKTAHGGRGWQEWPGEVRRHEAAALARATEQQRDEV